MNPIPNDRRRASYFGDSENWPLRGLYQRKRTVKAANKSPPNGNGRATLLWSR